MSKTKHKHDEEKQSIGSFLAEFARTMLFAFLIALLVSTFLFRPFRIPSGSMEPTLYNGDYLITSKYSIGYGKYAAPYIKLPIKKGRILEREPVRGDIIVFKPSGSKVHFIKRLIGLPGDEIQMKNGFLYINGTRQKTEEIAVTTETDEAGNPFKFRQYKEFFASLENELENSHMIFDKQTGSEVDTTGIYHVPVGHYFFMGDNRDRSLDSRYSLARGGIGYVPASHLVGRAEFILLSVDEGFSIKKPWTWGKMRGDRFLKGLR